MAAVLISWPGVTAAPLSCSEPAAGSVVMITPTNVLGGLSSGSLKPKSETTKVYS